MNRVVCVECNGTGEITRTTSALAVTIHERCAACQDQGEQESETITDGGAP